MEKIKIKTVSITIFTCIILILLAASILLLPACEGDDKSVKNAIQEESKYLEATVERRDMSSKINLLGIALAETKNLLSFEIDGDLLFVEGEGNTVMAGGKLAELEDENLLEELETLQSSIEEAKGLYEHELLKHHYTFENIEIEIELADYYYYHESQGRTLDKLIFEQQLLALEEQGTQADFELSQKEKDLADLAEEYENILGELTDELVLMAPYDCLVTSVSASEGNKIYADQQILEIIDQDSIIIRADLPEVDKNRIEENMETNIFFNAYTDNLLKGNVSRTGKIPVNTNAGTFYEIFIEFTDLQGMEIEDVYGLSAEIEIITSGGDNILVVPIDYVYSEGSKKYVYRITGDGGIEKTYIKTGISDLSYIEIVADLEEGDRVVINNQ